MQPPPRKAKQSASHLKTLQSEQVSKLQHKHQHEIEILEDIRLFAKQRSAVEKEYAQSLCKLAQQYLSKGKFPKKPDLSSEDGQEYKMVSEVWKTVLEETDRVGKIRLQAAETYLQQISEPVKPLKTSKTTVAKKVFEQIKLLQKEVDQGVQELVKSQKVYNEDEHVTHEAVTKAVEAESKVKNKSTGIFTSLAKLQQISSKLNSRRETCEVKSTGARNEYLLNMAATNVHLERYYISELPELIKMLDGEMYDKVRDFFITLSKMEVDCCGLTQESFMKILTDSTMISRQFDHQCFLHENLVFTDKVQYNFEPQENDQVTKVSQKHSASEQLNTEAKKHAVKVARQAKTIQQLQRKLDLLKNQSANGANKVSDSEPSSPTGPVNTEAKMDELRIAMRKAETSKRKSEARLNMLREGGVKVDEYVGQAQAEVDAEVVPEDEVSRKSVTSTRSESFAGSAGGGASNGDSVSNGGGADNKARSRTQSQTDSVPLPPNDGTYVNYQEDDFDETFAGNEARTTGQQKEGSIGYSSLGQNTPIKALALYDFQANNTDELSITENENVEVIGDGDGDGWVQARSSTGQVGFVPQNYLQYMENANGNIEDQNEMNVDHDTNGGYDSTVASAGYDSASASASAPASAGYDSVPSSAGFDTIGSSGDKTSNYSTTDYEIQDAIRPNEIMTANAMWARALYDFEATSEEELSFHEGQLIKILQKDENGVDDGWWKGEISGKVGVFPSLVVEEVSQADVTAHDLASPNRPGPPAFTPPEPGPLPPQLEITQPTPSDESGPTVATATTNEEDPPAAQSAEPKSDHAESADPPDEEDEEPLPPPPPELLASEELNDDAASTAVNYNSDSVETCSTLNGEMDAAAGAENKDGEAHDAGVLPPAGGIDAQGGNEHVVLAEIHSEPQGEIVHGEVDAPTTEGVQLEDEYNGESLL